jgi:hypothetical protein
VQQEERSAVVGRYRRYIIALAIIVVLVGAYAAAGFLAVPYFARKSAQDFVRSHYGRNIQIGEIHFNPFTLTLDVLRLTLPDADGQTLLSFKSLHVDLELATIWRLGPSFSEILLEEPYVRAVLRQGGALNLADLGQGFASEPSKPKEKSKPLRLFIKRFAVIAGTSIFEDHTRTPAFQAELKPIAFELRDFSTAPGSGNDYTLNAASPQGERLIWSGTLRLDPFGSHGVFEIADLQARTVWSYLRDSLALELDSGVIDIKGDYDLASGAGPLNLAVNVRSTVLTNLGVKPKGGAQNYIALARLEVDDTRLDLARHAVTVAKVQLSGGDIKAWLSAEGKLNLLELAGAGAAPAPSAASQPPPPQVRSSGGDQAPWTVAAPDIALQGFKISAEDRQVKPAAALSLSPLNVHVGGFSTAPEAMLDISVDTGVNGSGKISATAKASARSGALSGQLAASDLALTLLQPYVARYTSMSLQQGLLGAKFAVERRADGALSVKGDTQVADLHTVDSAFKQDFIKWRELRVADIRYTSQPASLRIGSVTALQPYVRMIIESNRTSNIEAILSPPGSAPQPTPAAAPAQKKPAPHTPAAKQAPATPAAPLTPFPMSVGTVKLVDGSANYTDLWIKPSFAIGMQNLGGTITGISSAPQSRAKVELNGKVDRYSPIHIGGSINMLAPAVFTDITMSFKDVDLTIVNPYSGHFAGYKIDKGKISVDVTYKINQRQLNAEQHLMIDQLELGERVDSPDAVHLPLKLAVALLRDRNGVIDLPLPLTGSLDDPKFSVWPIIWKVLVNVIVKAATAPFALLGNLFGGGEHVNVIEFGAGSATLEKAAQEQLASVAKGLKERPQLQLDVPIVYSASLDRPQLAAAHLSEELQARAQGTRAGKKSGGADAALADPQQHFKLLVEQYRADLGKDTALPSSALAVQQAKRKETPAFDPAIADLNAALIDHMQVPDADLEALGKARAQAIQDALLGAGQVDPARVFIVNAPPKPASGDKVQVEMALK